VKDFSKRTVERALHPASIAVVGASDSAFFGKTVLENLDANFTGEIIPVNPRREEVFGRRCYPSVEKSPSIPDIVVVTVPRERVSAAVSDAIAVGAACSVVMSSGFRETHEEVWENAEDDLARRSRKADHILIGPNCLGVVLAEVGAVAMGVPFLSAPKSGRIALAMQSGGLLGAAVKQLADYGTGVRYAISVGNGRGCGISDWLRIFATRDDISVIGLLIEELGADWREFANAVDLAHRSGQKIYALKVGRTSAGAEAVRSHTGSIAADYKIISAGLVQLGVREAHSYSELVMALALTERFAAPAVTGIGLASTSGGTNAIVVDMAAEAGLTFPVMDRRTGSDSGALGAFVTVTNPLDLGGNSIVELEASAAAVAGLLAEASIGVGVYAVTSLPDPRLTGHMELLRCVARAAETAMVPTIIAPLAAGRRETAHDELLNSLDWVMAAPTLAEAFSAIALWSKGRRAANDTRPRLADTDANDRHPSGAHQWLSEPEVKRTLAANASIAGSKVVAPRARVFRRPWDPDEVAATLEWPAYLKVVAPQLLHKTDAGLVRGPIADPEVVRQEAGLLAAAVTRVRLSGACLLVEEAAPEGLDLMLSVTIRTLGKVMVVGLGGTRRDLGADVSLVIEPVSDTHISEIVERYILESDIKYDRPSVQRARSSIVQLLRIMSKTCSAERLQVIECNPTRIDSTGRIWILDALALIRDAT
jgi:acetate---CoA ligase (ADP-forming)